MLAFTDVVDFLSYELAGLSRSRLALAGILAGAADGFSFRHTVLPA
jgi:hypothetical protein